MRTSCMREGGRGKGEGQVWLQSGRNKSYACYLIVVVMSVEKRLFLEDLRRTRQAVTVKTSTAHRSDHATSSPCLQACSQSSRGPGSNRRAVEDGGE